MRWNLTDWLAVLVFILFAGIYLTFAGYICNDQLKNSFDVIQGTHIFDVDDTYRLFLVREPFVDRGLWLWNFILPINTIFDGFFSWVSGHDVYIMRAAHIVAVLSSLFLVYRAGRQLKISAIWMLVSCCILLIMPLYVLLSMSFYGESLMAAAMGVVIYALSANRHKTVVFFLSIFPLIRPEGFFFLIMLTFQRLRERRFLSAFYIVLPGFIYFCFIMFAFNFSFDSYFGWRNALSGAESLVPANESAMGHALMPYYTINPLWWLLGLSGALLPKLRQFRPFFIAAALLILHWGWQSLAMNARGEARYFYALFPLFSLSLAAISEFIYFSLLEKIKSSWASALSISLVLVIIAVENFAQIDPLRVEFFKDRRWPLAGGQGAKPYFGVLSPEIPEFRHATAEFLHSYVQYDRSIKKVIVHAFPVFDDLEPSKLPADVEIEYSPMTSEATYNYFDGYFYAMFPEMPQYAFYRLSPAVHTVPNNGRQYALYVGSLYGAGEPLYANPAFQVYKVNYESFQGLPLELRSRAR